MSKFAVLGWGLVGPGAANIQEFEQLLASGESSLEPFNGFGNDNFLVGKPRFNFEDYRAWLAERFPPARIKQLTDKMDATTLYAVGSFIQAVKDKPALEKALTECGQKAHVYVANALGALPTMYEGSVGLYKAQRRTRWRLSRRCTG